MAARVRSLGNIQRVNMSAIACDWSLEDAPILMMEMGSLPVKGAKFSCPNGFPSNNPAAFLVLLANCHRGQKGYMHD